jgi:hypothetical protein
MAGERQPSHGGHHDPMTNSQSTNAGGLRFFAQSNVTMRVPTHFLGRDNALAEIEQALAHKNGRVAIVALYGLRGVGKTTLAAAYAAAIVLTTERFGGSGLRPHGGRASQPAPKGVVALGRRTVRRFEEAIQIVL